MFKNIGKNLKALASVIFYIGAALSFIVGVGTMALSKTFDSITISGIIVLVGGILLSYVIACLVYGLGELIGQTIKINKLLEMLLDDEE